MFFEELYETYITTSRNEIMNIFKYLQSHYERWQSK